MPARPTEKPTGAPRENSGTLVGCAGWSTPREHAHLFGPGESMLARYATRFRVVEINSSFYRPHQRKTYERWTAETPAGFRFTAKLPQEITHERALRGCAKCLDRFLAEVTGLGDKLACLLVQLPPSLVLAPRIASNFFELLRKRYAGGVACEPRHASWLEANGDAVFERFEIARVAADPPRPAEAIVAGGAGALRYWRWHGSPRMYYSRYEDEALAALAKAVRRRAPAGTGRIVIFDNTAHGHAAADAARLQALLAPRPKSR